MNIGVRGRAANVRREACGVSCGVRRAALMVMFAAVTSQAQSIAQRVGQVKDGTVRMSFASRSDVCGNGRGNISARSTSRTRHDEWEDECEYGPVRVAMDVADGKIIDIRSYVGGHWRPANGATDLGAVGVKDAVSYLLDVVARGQGSAAGKAIFPATIADSMVVWPQLLALAKDDSRTREVRHQAVFWVSQAAGEKATEGLVEVVGDKGADRDVREQAVFALSQRPKEESVPALIGIATNSKDPEIRRKAIFWLGQSHDPRAIDYFETVLLRK